MPGGQSIDSGPDKLPPQSIEAEQAILGAVLVNPDCIPTVLEYVKPENFYKQSHKYIYQAVLDLFDQNEPVDLVTVSEYLRDIDQLDSVGGRVYINDLALSVITTANVEYHARKVSEKSILRDLIRIGTSIVSQAYEENDIDKALDFAERLVFELGQRRDTRELTHIKDIVTESFHRIEERYENKDELLGLSSGFYDLDSLTAGFQKSDLIILAARPSMGKTAFCLNIAAEASIRKQTPIALFSLEMSKEQLVQRLLCAEAEIDAQRIRTGHMQMDDWTKLSTAMARLAPAPVFIDDTPAISVMEVRSKARKLKYEKPDLGLIIIDYLQLMEGDSRARGDRVQEISTISRGLKALAREIDVPVIALSQLSRAVEQRQNKKPMLSDLRESGSIEQDADIVMFIYRDEYYHPELIEKRGEAEIIIAKQRNGPVGSINLHFQPNITKFKNPVKPVPTWPT
ncbi:MAG: replicative DNA helicase [Cyanobacteriota bacterium]